MEWKNQLTKTLILGLFVILISIIGTPTLVNAQEGTLPDWFKGVANFWAEGQITNAEFIDAIEFLIDINVIKVPSIQAEPLDQTSMDEIWLTIEDLQNQVSDLQLLLSQQDSVINGQTCWDLNGNGVGDVIVRAGATSEDTNGDGIVDELDCIIFYVNNYTEDIAEGKGFKLNVKCEPGDHPTGGGHTGLGSWQMNIYSSCPSYNDSCTFGKPNGWTITGVHPIQEAKYTTLVGVYVICIDTTP